MGGRVEVRAAAAGPAGAGGPPGGWAHARAGRGPHAERSAAELGLDHTHVVSDLQTMLDSIGHDAGFGDYACLAAWQPDHPEDPALADVEQRVRSSAALDPARATRTTSRDMVRLLRGIWTDQAGPAEACARVRDLMAHQLTPHRLASGFGPPGARGGQQRRLARRGPQRGRRHQLP